MREEDKKLGSSSVKLTLCDAGWHFGLQIWGETSSWLQCCPPKLSFLYSHFAVLIC